MCSHYMPGFINESAGTKNIDFTVKVSTKTIMENMKKEHTEDRKQKTETFACFSLWKLTFDLKYSFTH